MKNRLFCRLFWGVWPFNLRFMRYSDLRKGEVLSVWLAVSNPFRDGNVKRLKARCYEAV